MSDMNYMDESSPVNISQSYMPGLQEREGVGKISPVIYRAGIVKQSEDIYGVMVKGVEGGAASMDGVRVPDSVALAVSIPASLAQSAGLGVGDRLLTYFVGEKVKARQFNIVHVYEPLVRTDDRHVVYADLADMQRLNGWTQGEASMFEVTLSEEYRDAAMMKDISRQMSYEIRRNASEEDDVLVAVSSADRYSQIFDWIELIDFNVLFVLILMIAVAAVNMMTGLLIMLFENISTIGLLKALGMTDREVSKVFISSSAVLVMQGMAIGNALALLFCLIQEKTHFLKMNPENYFVSYVPVDVNFGAVLATDLISFAAILLLLLVPTIFISKVDPAQTVRVK
jgi:lipoprotein-releasing system permease protein